MPDITREIADLRQTEAFLLDHGMKFLTPIPLPHHLEGRMRIVRIWMHVRERREALELEARNG